jgi:hypothetical protein
VNVLHSKEKRNSSQILIFTKIITLGKFFVTPLCSQNANSTKKNFVTESVACMINLVPFLSFVALLS